MATFTDSLKDAASVAGAGFLGASGPSGRASATSLLNNRLRLAEAQRQSDLELSQLAEEKERKKLTQMVEMVKTGLTDPASRAAIEASGDLEKFQGMGRTALSGLGQPPELVDLFVPEAADADKGFTLSPGQQRFDAAGNPVASVPKGEGDDTTERQRKISGLMGRGFSQDDAADLVEGRIRLTSPDEFGRVSKVNLATNEVTPLVAGSQAPQEAPVEPAPQGASMFEAAREGTGPISALQQGVSNLFGFMVEGQLFPENAKARQKLNLFNKAAQESLIQNPRFPVAEQEFVKSLLPSTDKILKDPDDAVSSLVELQNHLESKIQANERSLESGLITEKRSGELANQNDAMKRVLSIMGEEVASPEQTMGLARKIADGTASDEEFEEYLRLKGQ